MGLQGIVFLMDRVTLSNFYDLLTVGNGFWNSDSTHKNVIIIFAPSPLLFGATFLYKPKYHIVDVLYIPLYSIVIHVPHHYIPLYSIIIPLYTPWYSIVFHNIALHSILFHIISEQNIIDICMLYYINIILYIYSIKNIK